jgi:ABC-type multidrug transport system permease subunit
MHYLMLLTAWNTCLHFGTLQCFVFVQFHRLGVLWLKVLECNKFRQAFLTYLLNSYFFLQKDHGYRYIGIMLWQFKCLQRSRKDAAWYEISPNPKGFLSSFASFVVWIHPTLCAGLTAKVLDQTHSMKDVYGAFYDFANMLSAKVSLKTSYYYSTFLIVSNIIFFFSVVWFCSHRYARLTLLLNEPETTWKP